MNVYDLMCGDTQLAQINMITNECTVLEPDLLPICLRGRLGQQNAHNANLIFEWAANRTITTGRTYAKEILSHFDFAQGSMLAERAALSMFFNCTSVLDSYWLVEAEALHDWNTVNIRKQPLSNAMLDIALSGVPTLQLDYNDSPDLHINGAYPKVWRREDGDLYLYKLGATKGAYNESRVEVSVSNILRELNIPHVSYTLGAYKGNPVCKCKCMSDDRFAVIPFADVFVSAKSLAVSYMKNIDSKAFYTMNVIDYLIANDDRHIENWGAYMSNATGCLVSLHPLFDHNEAFHLCNYETQTMSKVVPTMTMQQLAVVSAQHIDPMVPNDLSVDLFLSEEVYSYFMKRADELHMII